MSLKYNMEIKLLGEYIRGNQNVVVMKPPIFKLIYN